MYIQPNSVVRLLRGIRLDPSYENTLYFESETAQATWFLTGHSAKTFNAHSYQRVHRDRIRVEISADEIYDYNYLMFKNSSPAYNNKWFYAFITKIEYVNEVTAEVTYELDVMQTWMFNVVFGECLVEREHVTIDTVGANLVGEELDGGDTVTNSISGSGHCDSYVVCLSRNLKSGDAGVTPQSEDDEDTLGVG